MAEAVLGLLMQNLSSLIQREFGLVWGVQKDMEKLCSILSTIRDVLEDAEQKQLNDKPIANWLSKLKDAAYDAEDILDGWSTKVGGSESELKDKSFTKQVSSFLSSSLDFKQIMFRRIVEKKIKEIISKFDEISEEKSKFHLSSCLVLNRVQFNQTRETSSLLAEEVVYGRDGDREKIIDMLLSNVNREEDVSVLPILGTGGLGKTTLAQLVYHDQRVVNHFDARVWVCVSDDFEVKRLTKMILDSLSGTTCDLQDLDPMQRRLQDKLSGKKLLLVLDDVWNEDLEKWDKLKFSLTFGAKGSSIVVTTRLETVTSITGTLSPRLLTFLSEEDCWSLFNRRAFGVGNEEITNLVEIGKQIVKKCGGVPLAAKTLGGLMFVKRNVNEWLYIRDSKIWELSQDKECDILPALRLSYNHLPSHWRQCFSYCSIFPKDYKIDKEELIHLWMANGFVQSDGRMELEDAGEHIFIELLRRSFFQDISKNDMGNVSSCKMHDLMHDLACLVSVEECSTMEVSKSGTFPKGIRHRSLVFDTNSLSLLKSISLQPLLQPSPVLRTQLLLGYWKESMASAQILLRNFDCLRALDISGTATKEIPSSIGKAKHLRYLNLSSTVITLLPESICNLRNLQLLKLRNCKKLQILSKHMHRIKALRHLDLRECDRLTETPTGIGQLTQLQTLSLFVVGLEFGKKIKELQALERLGGELMIKGLEKVRNLEEAKEANLKTKQNLSSLKLCWSGSIDCELQEKVLEEGLQPHPSLKLLWIQGYEGEKLPSWITFLLNLVEIVIDHCSSCSSLPPLGQLSLLKVLRIEKMNSVKCIGGDFYGKGANVVQGFPSLERLEITDMPHLEDWIGNPRKMLFPSLKSLTIESCPMLTSFPLLPCLEQLKLERCNEMILRSVGKLTPCLSSLAFSEFKQLISLPDGIFLNTTALVSLSIMWCEKLKSIPPEIENLTALASLKIGNCKELVFLPEEGLQKLISLTYLQISYCENIVCLPKIQRGFNSSLSELVIRECRNLTYLSDGLRHLTSLKALSIVGCPKLELSEEVGFQHLISLRSLNLQHLPQLRALPDGMQYLTMLKELYIWDCENLTRLPE